MLAIENVKNCFSAFSTDCGEELFFVLESDPGISDADSVANIHNKYLAAMRDHGLNSQTEMCIRLHFRNADSRLINNVFSQQRQQSFFSYVQQPPVSGNNCALTAYHIKSDAPARKKRTDQAAIIHHNSYQSIWAHNAPISPDSSHDQTRQAFDHLKKTLSPFNARIEPDSIRTWIYVKDIEQNYAGMVDARNKLFSEIGLTQNTHYLASTGIEGSSGCQGNLVTMDSLSIKGLAPEQITYMSVPDYMSHTYIYNVAFERGTRITYGDRSHFYISGTASIDHHGRVLFLDDIEKQTQRALLNVEKLLQAYDSDLNDLKTAVVYLKHPQDYLVVKSILDELLPKEVAYIMVHAAVCRPTWLVEIEGIAVSDACSTQYPSFL